MCADRFRSWLLYALTCPRSRCISLRTYALQSLQRWQGLTAAAERPCGICCRPRRTKSTLSHLPETRYTIFIIVQASERDHAPPELSFGWQRATLLGAFFNGVFLLALGVSIFLQAIERFVDIQGNFSYSPFALTSADQKSRDSTAASRSDPRSRGICSERDQCDNSTWQVQAAQ